jgi:hypothetical protein
MVESRRYCILLGWLTVIIAGTGDPKKLFGADPPTPVADKLKYEEPRYIPGKIYAQGSSRQELLFDFKRVTNRSGPTLRVEREFNYPDGKPAVRERVVYENDALVSYELEEIQIGMAGSARIRHSTDNPAKSSIEFEYGKQQAGGKVKTRTETLAENTLVGDMVGVFLLSHWDALVRGEKVKCRYIVVPRRETVGFAFVKDSESKWQGKDVIVIKMHASSTFIAALVEPVFFTIKKAPPHHVLQYVGRTTPKLQSGSKWKDLDAVTIFDWDSAR